MVDETEIVDDGPKVLYMGDHLLRKLSKREEAKTNIRNTAEKISKKDNPSEDQFAGPLIAKAERMDKEDEALKNHIRFIMRGGFGEQVNTNGYRLQYENAVPKSVTITLNPMKND
jgi:hypothetical protein